MTYKKKIGIMIVSLAVVLCALVTGTLAWLIDDTEPITSTFTPSSIDVELTEVFNTASDKWEGKLIPGTTLVKKATVTVENDIDCYVFVKAEESDNLDNFITWAIAEGWTALDGVENVYYREVAATADAENKTFNVVKDDVVTVNSDVDKEDMETLTSPDLYPKLIFTAYAAQKAGFDTPVAVWTEIAPP